MSSAFYVLRLASARLRRRRGPFLLAAGGLAAGAAVVVAVLVGSVVAQDRSVSQAIERVPAAQRSVRADWFGVPSTNADLEPVLDRQARAAFADLSLGRPTPIVLYRESTLAGRFAALAAIDGVKPWVVLRSGRLPRPCRPERCEVLRLRGAGPIPDRPKLHLVQVGTASLRSRLLFGDYLAPTDNALAQAELAPAFQRASRYHRPPPAPLLLANGVGALASSPELTPAYRSYAWVWPLAPGRPRLWQIDGLLDRVERGRAELQTHSFAFDVQAPVQELRAAQSASRITARRLLLVGGEAAALLFAFAVLAAASMRRDLDAARDRLRLYGARRWQLALLTLAESAAVAVAGTAVGWLAGVASGAVVAERAGSPVGDALRESALSAHGVGLAVGVALAATIVLAVAVSFRPSPRTLDGLAIAAIAVVVAALAGGAADRSRLATSDNAGLVLLVLPGLLAFAAAVAAARLLAPCLRLVERAARRRVGLRLAMLSLSRGPGTALVAAAFLVVSFSLALLAEGYRATLSRSERDGAAFQVPLDFAVREDLTKLVPVLDAASLRRFRELGPDVGVVPVLRVTSSAGPLERVTGVTVLGLPAGSLPHLRDVHDRDALVARVSDGDHSVQGIALSPRTKRLTLVASGGPVHVFATVFTPDGDVRVLDLGATGSSTRTLGAAIPAAARGGRLISLELDPATKLQERGADAGQAQPVRVRLGLPALASWVGVGGARVRSAPGGVLVSASLTAERTTRIRAPQATDGAPPPVLATPALARVAGPDGILPVDVGGEKVPVRVVATVPRFPGATGDVVVGDLNGLVAALTAAQPGTARVGEVWLSVPSDARARQVSAALERQPFAALQTTSRRALEADAEQDPLAHGTLLTLLVAALIALGLAVVGLLLTVVADLRDERGELLDLEAEGAVPSLLRRVVRARALVVAAFGLVGGALAGAALAALVTDVVTVTARAAAPEPPLVLTFDARLIALAVLVYGGLAVILVALTTRRAFAEEAP